jgi:hypothetical protein
MGHAALGGREWVVLLPCWRQLVHAGSTLRKLAAAAGVAGGAVLGGVGWLAVATADVPEWTSRAVASQGVTAPVERCNHAMTFDSIRGLTVMFGGFAGARGGGRVGDTWTWDGAQWQALLSSEAGPAARELHAMAFDPARGVAVMFGGVDRDGSVRGDVWEFDGTTWAERPQSGNLPTARYGHAMVYDGAAGGVLVFGGQLQDGTASDELWRWSGTDWSRVEASGPVPGPRSMHVMAFDTERGVAVLHGGRGADGPRGDTWEWTGMQWRTFGTDEVAARSSHAMAYDSARGVTVMVGGDRGDSLASWQVWEWNGIQWRQGSPGAWRPPAGFGRAMAFDSLRNRAVLMGGISGMTLTAEAWEFGQPCSGPSWDVEPIARRLCGSDTTMVSVITGTTGPANFQWWKDGSVIDPLVNPSAATGILLVQGDAASVDGWYDCVISNDCGTTLSATARLPVAWCVCSMADVCGGGPNGDQPDGTVDGADFIAFMNGFASGTSAVRSQADIAGGGEFGDQPDGTVDGSDFIAFLNAFTTGC